MLRLPSTRMFCSPCGVVDTVCESLGSESSNVASAVEMVLDAAMNFDRSGGGARRRHRLDRRKNERRTRRRRRRRRSRKTLEEDSRAPLREPQQQMGRYGGGDGHGRGIRRGGKALLTTTYRRDGSTAASYIHAGNDLILMSWRSTEERSRPPPRGKMRHLRVVLLEKPLVCSCCK